MPACTQQEPLARHQDVLWRRRPARRGQGLWAPPALLRCGWLPGTLCVGSPKIACHRKQQQSARCEHAACAQCVDVQGWQSTTPLGLLTDVCSSCGAAARAPHGSSLLTQHHPPPQPGRVSRHGGWGPASIQTRHNCTDEGQLHRQINSQGGGWVRLRLSHARAARADWLAAGGILAAQPIYGLMTIRGSPGVTGWPLLTRMATTSPLASACSHRSDGTADRGAGMVSRSRRGQGQGAAALLCSPAVHACPQQLPRP